MKTSHITAIIFGFIFFFACTYSYAEIRPETALKGVFRVLPEWNNVQRKCSLVGYGTYKAINKQIPMMRHLPEEQKNKMWIWIGVIAFIGWVIESLLQSLINKK